MFDRFSILSGHLFYGRTRTAGDDRWLIESSDRDEDNKGTSVKMTIGTKADWTVRDVFDKYQGGDIYFRKTHIPISLGRYPGEQLVSRSQAKRILARLTEFSEVLFDFQGVTEIGQAFADEIFRVFRGQHPGTMVITFNTSESVKKMIEYVEKNGSTVSYPPSDPPFEGNGNYSGKP